MNTAVVYFSRTGSTKKIAQAIALEAGCKAENAADFDTKRPIDLLFIGGAIYGGKIDETLLNIIDNLKSGSVKRAAVFTTYASAESANGKMKTLLEDKGIKTEDLSFACKGKFLFFNRKRPDEKDLKNAKEFAASVIGGK